MINKQSLYSALPNPLKTLAASAWGCYLRWWRYSKKTEVLVRQTLERDHWSEEDWKHYREDSLDHLLDRAVKQVPYYRNQWNERRRKGDQSSWHYLENWPILTKETVRKNNDLFLAVDCNPRKLYVDHTGGTTGTPLSIYESRETVQHWYAMYEARIRRWHHVSWQDRWAIFGGQMVVPLNQKNPPFWVENKALHQLYLSTFHISPQNVPEYIRKINEFKPTHIVVYPSSATEFALEVIRQGASLWRPEVIFSNAEPLSDNQRKNISTAFNCQVINTYGMGEIAFGASECEHFNLHAWPDSGILEVVDENGQKARDGEPGSFIMTGLTNNDFPLIRYEIGDRGTSERWQKCDCGRSLPVLHQIEGRNSDMLITADGRKVYWLNPVFTNLKITQAQIIQEELDSIRVIVVPANGFGVEDTEIILSRLHDRVGSTAKIIVDQVDSIPRGKNGKFKPVISKLM